LDEGHCSTNTLSMSVQLSIECELFLRLTL